MMLPVPYRGPNNKKYIIGPGLSYLGGKITCICDVRLLIIFQKNLHYLLSGKESSFKSVWSFDGEFYEGGSGKVGVSGHH